MAKRKSLSPAAWLSLYLRPDTGNPRLHGDSLATLDIWQENSDLRSYILLGDLLFKTTALAVAALVCASANVFVCWNKCGALCRKCLYLSLPRTWGVPFCPTSYTVDSTYKHWPHVQGSIAVPEISHDKVQLLFWMQPEMDPMIGI